MTSIFAGLIILNGKLGTLVLLPDEWEKLQASQAKQPLLLLWQRESKKQATTQANSTLYP